MENSSKTDKPKIATAGKLEIAINHFTTDITQLPYWMDSNCYIVFSLLWRRYISASINEKLITPDGWFQYTMKSLMIHCGFRDKGTLQRAVEGLFRSGLIDVRVEAGSRMWACWKMNKKNIEYVASLPEREAMQEPRLNSINTIGSKDKNFTYQWNKEGITELMKFFMVNSVENPPLFNTITQYHYNTTSQYNNSTSLPYNYTTLPPQDNIVEVPSEKNKEEEMEREFGKPMEEEPFEENGVNGESEQKSKNEIDAKENPSQSQSLNINHSGGSQDSITTGFQVEESSSEYQFNEEESQQGEHNVSCESDNTKSLQEMVQEEFREFRKEIDPELDKLKDCTTKDEFSTAEKQFLQFLNRKLDESNFSHEAVRKQVDFYVDLTIDKMENRLFQH